MTQQLHDLTIETWVSGNTTVHRMQQDLLALRAAVRRVHDAEDNYEQTLATKLATSKVVCWSRDIVEVEKRKLRAEMAGIDGKEQKP